MEDQNTPEKEPDKLDLEEKLEKLAIQVRTLLSQEYYELVELIRNPVRLMWINLLIGLARGIGIFIGMTVVGALLLVVSAKLLSGIIDLPLIGRFVADLVDAVTTQMTRPGR
ncbi:MAG: DUF5665 domain-containing protein [bacterium]|nr:DUF5665 domain-containing protein [bacterium]